jgi:sarcosine oxidase
MRIVEKVDAVVVGAGVAGSATARHLARSGREVLLVERFEVGHRRGSSHGASRIFRFSYDDPEFVRMAMDALPMWRALEKECAEELIVTTGGLDIGPAAEAHARALGDCGAPYEWLAAAEASDRFPFMSFASTEPVLFQPDAGIVRADRALRAFVASAVAAGAQLWENCRVHEVVARDGGAVLTTDEGEVEAEVTVVTAGSWARPLLAEAGIELPVEATRQTVAYFAMDDQFVPPSVVEWTHPPLYALLAPGEGVKAGGHHIGPACDPDELGAPDAEVVARLAEWIAARYPKADPEPKLAETCLYTSTSDEHFVIERHGPIVVGSACSGHGFKFGPLTGRRIAELAMSR